MDILIVRHSGTEIKEYVRSFRERKRKVKVQVRKGKKLMWEDKILHAAVEHFGADHQLNKLTEEVGELLVAVAHWRIGKDSANHVAEEIADSIIMMKQSAIILGIEADVEQWKMDKLCALEKRVGGSDG